MIDKIVSCRIHISKSEILPENTIYVLFKNALPVDESDYNEFKVLMKETFEHIFPDIDQENINVYPNDDFLVELKKFISRYITTGKRGN